MEALQVLSAVAIGLSGGLISVALVRLPRTPIAPPLYVFVAAGAMWAVGDLVADTASDMTWKLVGVSILYTGSIALPACWWAVALRWSEEEHAGLPLRAAAWRQVPFAFAAAMWLVMITNPLHGAFLTPVVGGRNVYQPLWYVMAVPNYGLILGALLVELAVVRRVRSREVRRQGALLIAASVLTLVCNALYVSNVIPVNLTATVLAISGALLVVGMAREGLFGVMPNALSEIAADHPDGLVVTGPDGRVRFANTRTKALLAPVDMLHGVSILDTLRDARLRPESSDRLSRGSVDAWAMLTRPDGVVFLIDAERPRWVHVSAKAVMGRRGRTNGHSLRITDRTAQKEAELHARQARRLDSVADLARTVSRQFQGAFALVHSNAELLLADPDCEPASGRRLARIVEAADYGSELARELQLYTGSVNTRRIVLELSEIVEEGCELVKADLPTGVRLVLSQSEELLPVHVDAIQVRHCMFNVLMNAIDAMEDKTGEIRVFTGIRRFDPAAASLVWGADQPQGDYAYFRVRDDGGGMTPETEERAFEPFFSTRQKDRGVGLSTVLGIARAHGAPIALENEVGRGCDVAIYFPLERGVPC